MRKIGTTSTGAVIVEMAKEQFEALVSLQTPAANSQTTDIVPTATERVAYVRERIAKLKPKKKAGVTSSIRAMFQFNGGISDQHIEEVIAALQKEKFFRVAADGLVTYAADRVPLTKP